MSGGPIEEVGREPDVGGAARRSVAAERGGSGVRATTRCRREGRGVRGAARRGAARKGSCPPAGFCPAFFGGQLPQSSYPPDCAPQTPRRVCRECPGGRDEALRGANVGGSGRRNVARRECRGVRGAARRGAARKGSCPPAGFWSAFFGGQLPQSSYPPDCAPQTPRRQTSPRRESVPATSDAAARHLELCSERLLRDPVTELAFELSPGLAGK